MVKMDEKAKVGWFLKYTIFVINFLFWIMGCVMMGVGTWAFLHRYQFDVNEKEEEDTFIFLFDAAVVLIVIGLFIFLLAFTGCVGALRENVTLLKIFYWFLAMVFIMELVGTTLAFVFSEQVKHTLKMVMQTQVLTRYRDSKSLMKMMDFFQIEFGCCGIGEKGYLDWEINPYFKCNITTKNRPVESCSVPYSCCLDPTGGMETIDVKCASNVLGMEFDEVKTVIYTGGCMEEALGLARNNLHIIGGIAVTVSLLQTLSIYMARKLASQIKAQMGSGGRKKKPKV